jgi:anti-sigma B factor antagonist
MDMQERTQGAVALIDVSGKLVAGEHNGKLKDKVNSLIFQGRRQIVLNLAGVSYIDSTGLGELVATHTTMAKQGGQVVLVALTARVQDLLAICRLLTVFDVFDTEAEALASLATVTEVP